MSILAKCRICEGPLGPALRVREMMYGTRDEFDYFPCQNCGCLQISEIPKDIALHYPEDYYSFSINKKKRSRWLRDLFRRERNLYPINKKGVLGAILSFIRAPDPVFSVYGRVGLDLKDSILDVGGGGGGHIQALRFVGINNAIAIDLFIESDVEIDGDLIAKKASIFEINETYDLITFHHSFEHMDQQLAVLEKARNLLSRKGKILIRIPTVSSQAFETYGSYWSDLDAPRHFYLHSHKSIKLLAETAGLQVSDMWCDSVAFQFWASEQYQAGIPLNDLRSYSQDPQNSMFTQDQILKFENKSETLNDEMRGDTVCVVLTKKSEAA